MDLNGVQPAGSKALASRTWKLTYHISYRDGSIPETVPVHQSISNDLNFNHVCLGCLEISYSYSLYNLIPLLEHTFSTRRLVHSTTCWATRQLATVRLSTHDFPNNVLPSIHCTTQLHPLAVHLRYSTNTDHKCLSNASQIGTANDSRISSAQTALYQHYQLRHKPQWSDLHGMLRSNRSQIQTHIEQWVSTPIDQQ